MRSIYFDNSASTVISEEALQKYIEVSRESYGNPSSLHSMGVGAEGEIRLAKQRIKDSVGAKNFEVIFTSSGSEANNLAIIGRALSKDRYLGKAKIITTMGEHASVNEPILRLKSMGFKTVCLPTVGGVLDFDALIRELDESVILLSVMMVNNETGAIYDLPRAAKELKKRCPDAMFHVDATQGYMKLPFTMAGIGADMLTISSHKIHGPKGVGALLISNELIKTRGLAPIILGGGQEKGLRSGTENVPGIAAFGEAVVTEQSLLTDSIKHMNELREGLIRRIRSKEELKEVQITDPTYHAPHILNLTLPRIKSETMLHYLNSLGIFVSSGSACSSNTGHLSDALTAFGKSAKEADSSIRISFSRTNTMEEIDELVAGLCSGVKKLARMK